MKMRFYITAILLSFLSVVHSQIDPFNQIGKEKKVISLSNGTFIELENNDSLQQIGTVIVNTETGAIFALLEIDTLYSESTLEPTVYSRFYSLDAMAAKRPDQSPYKAFLNNPIMYMDPDGNFEVPATTAQAYPLVNHFLKSVKSYYLTGQMPEIFKDAFPDGLGEALKQYSGLTDEQLLVQLTYVFDPDFLVKSSQSNPEIHANNLDVMDNGELHPKNGEAYPYNDPLGNGKYGESTVVIDDNLFQDLEKALYQMGYAKDEVVEYRGDQPYDFDVNEQLSNAERAFAVEAFMATFFHEAAIHEGRAISGIGDYLTTPEPMTFDVKVDGDHMIQVPEFTTQGIEPGKVFETKVYGKNVGRIFPKDGKIKTD